MDQRQGERGARLNLNTAVSDPGPPPGPDPNGHAAPGVRLTRSWRHRHRRADPEAQVKSPGASGSSTGPEDVVAKPPPSIIYQGIDFKKQYDEFQEDFQQELDSRKLSDGWSDAKLRYLSDKYLGQRYEVGDPQDATFGAQGHIVYFKHGTQQLLERALPVKGMTFTTDSFMEMERDWIRQSNEDGTSVSEQPDVRWIHLPANNMMWIEQAMLNILEFYHASTPGDSVSGTVAREIRDNILQSDYWRHRSNRSLEGRLWGRYMQPFSRCIKSPPTEGDISPSLSIPTLALYLPYLHWERNGAAAYMRNVAQDVHEHYPMSYRFSSNDATAPIAQLSRCGASQDEKLVRRYLRCKSHLHIRHTLDQFFHPYLRDFSDRDYDQVIERYAQANDLENYDEFKDESPLLMVDQLWLWVIGGNTILTCFPTTWGMQQGVSDPLDVRTKIMVNLEKQINHSCYDSALLVANIIINQCAANMLEPTMLVHERHKFVNFFDRSITFLMERQTRSLKRLLCMSTPDRLDAHEKLLDTTDEFSMLAEGRDIEEELKIINVIMTNQEESFKQFGRALYKHQAITGASSGYSMERMHLGLQTRKRSIEGILKAIKGVNEQILQLLGLKQQQASISEARSSRILAEQGDKQSASMMAFTVVTIIFLPLSTMTSFFGVNSVEMGSGAIPLGTVSAYIFPISAICVLLSFFFGFNHQARRTMLMWLEYFAESLTGPDRNHFWAAREKSIKARLKRKQRQKRAQLIKSRQRRQQAQGDNIDDSSDEGGGSKYIQNPYRSHESPRSSLASQYAANNNLIESRQERTSRRGSHSTSHIYTSGPDTEEEISDRPISPDSRLGLPRSSRPSGTNSVRPGFLSGLVQHPENESAVLDDHHDAIPPITVHGPDLRASQGGHAPASPPYSQPNHERLSSPNSRGSRLRENTVIRAASQASQQRESRASISLRNPLPPEVGHIMLSNDMIPTQTSDLEADRTLERQRTRSV